MTNSALKSTNQDPSSGDTSLLAVAIKSYGLKVVSAILGVLVSVLLARILGPEQFGQYSIIIAAVTLVATVAVLGLPSLVTREVAIFQTHGELGKLKGLLLVSHRWVGAASILASLACLLGFVFLENGAIAMFGWLMLLLLVPLGALNQLRASFLRGLNWIVLADFPEFFLRPFVALAMLLLVYGVGMDLNINGALLIQAVAVFFAFLLGSWFLAKRLPKEIGQIKANESNQLWEKGAGLFFLIAIIGLLDGQIPLYLLGLLSSLGEAGLFQVANQMVSIVIMGLVAVNMPLQPKLASAWSRADIQEAQLLVSHCARLGLWVSLATAIILMLCAETIMSVFGQEYLGAANVLRVLVIGQVINAAFGPCGIVLVASGHQKQAFFAVAVSLIANVLICAILVPAYSAIGAAISVGISILVWNVLMYKSALRLTNINTSIAYRKI